MNYRFSRRFQAGLEWNPLDDDWGPLANWTALEETKARPAFILGTSSDRIGTDRGQSYYGTFSKSLAPWLDLPIAPYVGAAFRDADDEWTEVAGLNYLLFDRRLSVTHLWDGENFHTTLDVPVKNAVVGLLLAQQEDPSVGEGKDYFVGVSLGLRLSQPRFLRDD